MAQAAEYPSRFSRIVIGMSVNRNIGFSVGCAAMLIATSSVLIAMLIEIVLPIALQRTVRNPYFRGRKSKLS